MTTLLLILQVATLEVAAVFYLVNSLPRRHWLRLRATRSMLYASGPPVDVCRRIGLACIRGRRG